MIPGARKVRQVQDNVAAANLLPLTGEEMATIAGFSIPTSASKCISAGEALVVNWPVCDTSVTILNL